MVTFNRKYTTTQLLVVVGAGVIMACSKTATPAEGPAAAPQQAGSEEAAPVHFDEMSASQKMKHMKKVVAPHMAKVFQEIDPEDSEDFGCPTCHGSGARSGNFTMPNPGLPVLTPEEMEEHPEITKFMKERVVPEMAKLLGEAPYDQETGKGFGCYHCHTKGE